MNRTFRRFLAFMVQAPLYAAYFLLVGVVLLWFLFPAPTVRDWLQYRLNRELPAVTWKIGSVGLRVPDGLVLSDVWLGSAMGQGEPLLTIGRISLLPDVQMLVHDRRGGVRFHMVLLGGTVDGMVSRVDKGKMLVRGRLGKIRLAELKTVQQELGRRVSGTLSGIFSLQDDPKRLLQAHLQADLLLEQGILRFRQPVLGLDQLAYSRIGTSLVTRDGMIVLEKGKIESKLLSGTFSATITPAPDLAACSLNMQGSIVPRPELFAGIGDQAGVQMIRSQLQDGRLAFTVTGSLAQPGIQFPALSGLPGNHNQGGGR